MIDIMNLIIDYCYRDEMTVIIIMATIASCAVSGFKDVEKKHIRL